MLVAAELYEVINGRRGMLRGIDACIQSECLVSAVALIYSAIDAISALTRPIEAQNTTSEVFIDWAGRYIKPEQRLNCTAEDLYGARCGILHNYGPDSHKRRQGKAKLLVYKWKDGPDPEPNRQASLPANTISLHLEDLYDSLKEAVGAFLKEVGEDETLNDRVDHHCMELLCYRPWSAIPIHVAA